MSIRLLHRRVFGELLFIFLLSLASLLSLILIGRMLQLRELFLAQGLGLMEIAELFVYLSPFFMLLLVPIACMLSIFLVFLRMSTDRELLALRAGGVSLYQMLPAPIIFSVVCTLLTAWVSFVGLSWGMDNFKDTVLSHIRTRTQLMLQPGVFNRDFPGLTLFAEQVDPGTKHMKMVFVRDETRPGVSATIVAPEGTVATDSRKGQILFLLKDGHIYRADKDNGRNKLDVLGFSRYAVRLDLSRLFRGYRIGDEKPKEMSWTRLHEVLDNPDYVDMDGGKFMQKVRVEIVKRQSMPVACIVLGFFAIPFAFAFQGLKQYLGLVMAMVFFLVYYTMVSIGTSLGEIAVLTPAVGLWTPNVLFFFFALVGTRMAARERFPNIVERLAHIRFRRGKECPS